MGWCSRMTVIMTASRNFLEAYRRSRRVFWSRKIIIIIIII